MHYTTIMRIVKAREEKFDENVLNRSSAVV